MHPTHVLNETRFEGEARTADFAGKWLFAPVASLVPLQRVLVLEPLPAKTALQLRFLVLQHVKSQLRPVPRGLPTDLALKLPILDVVYVHMGL